MIFYPCLLLLRESQKRKRIWLNFIELPLVVGFPVPSICIIVKRTQVLQSSCITEVILVLNGINSKLKFNCLSWFIFFEFTMLYELSKLRKPIFVLLNYNSVNILHVFRLGVLSVKRNVIFYKWEWAILRISVFSSIADWFYVQNAFDIIVRWWWLLVF